MDLQRQFQAAYVFANAFAESFGESLTSKLGVPWLFKSLDDSDAAKQSGPVVHFRLSAIGGLQGECFVTFEQENAVALGSKLLGQSATASSNQQDEALVEVIELTMEGLSSALSAKFGTVTLTVARVEDVPLEKMLAVHFVASGEDQMDTRVLLHFNGVLLAALSSLSEGGLSDTATRTATDPANLQLVMDVELNVSLRFGQCQLPLRDVLDLASGSVIELDRDVDDPVELLLDGKVIARGEAVIVDGNYGLRVTEITEPIASHFVR
jgi:flagellar motor switch protein FliN/FliY